MCSKADHGPYAEVRVSKKAGALYNAETAGRVGRAWVNCRDPRTLRVLWPGLKHPQTWAIALLDFVRKT